MDRVIANEASAREMDEDDVRFSFVKGVSMKTWSTAQDIANTIGFLSRKTENSDAIKMLEIKINDNR